ncbi:MAG: hypothetical protein U9R15_09745 [Chloroflexota bacterium]|nr:hypothetical protein [Chloroflexota bacterium]
MNKQEIKKFTVFVIDDDVEFCKLLRALVGHTIFTSKLPGYDVVLVTHSDMQKIADAIKYIKVEKPDLILLDYMLGPAADSCLESLDLLKEIVPCSSDIRLLTGMHLEDIRLEAVKKFLVDAHLELISKPFGAEILVDIIKKSIRKKENVKCN